MPKHILAALTIVVVIGLHSCSPNKTEQAILDYRQTIGNTKTDFSMKILELEKVGVYTYGDSANILKSTFYSSMEDKEMGQIPIDSILFRISENINGWEGYILELDSAVRAMEQLKRTNDFEYTYKKSKIPEYSQKVKGFKESYNQLDSLNTIIKQYESSANKELAAKWKCKYSIKNPLLNNVTQELTETFLITPENKVIGIIP